MNKAQELLAELNEGKLNFKVGDVVSVEMLKPDSHKGMKFKGTVKTVIKDGESLSIVSKDKVETNTAKIGSGDIINVTSGSAKVSK